MKCRPVVHARFTAVSWLIALVYRGVINDVTLCSRETIKGTFTMITSDDLLERYVSFEVTNGMFHYRTDDRRKETFLQLIGRNRTVIVLA